MGLFSKAAAHGLAALIDLRCSRYVRSSINRTGAADPERPFACTHLVDLMVDSKRDVRAPER
jgi:hypothetical protein